MAASTGDMIREEIHQNTAVGASAHALVQSGQLVPDETMSAILDSALNGDGGVGKHGYLLDGFPRNVAQAEHLDAISPVERVINITMREDILVAKICGRRVCDSCGVSWNVANVDTEASDGARISMPPVVPEHAFGPGRCSADCGGSLFQREDDNEATVKARLAVFWESTTPVIEHYRAQGLVSDVEIVGGYPVMTPVFTEVALRRG